MGEGVGGDSLASPSASFPAAGSQRSEALNKIVDFYPEDNNSIQISYPGLWVGVVCASQSCPLCVASSKWPLGLH